MGTEAPHKRQTTRTRKLEQKQSKYGCETCKQRKVKCDEQLPTCLRCLKTGRDCDGYRRISKIQHINYDRCVDVPPAVGSAGWDSVQQQMLRLTLDFFSCDPHRLHSQASVEIFQVLLPQLVQTQNCVSTAAAALGAAYDLCILQRHGANVALSLKLYLAALRQIQQELRRKDPEIVPLVVAATLLAAAESVQQQQQVAFDHVSGAFDMAYLRSRQVDVTKAEVFGALLTLFNSLDQHISLFIWGRIPGFSPMPIHSYMQTLTTVDDLVASQPVLHQNCLHFLGNAAHAMPCTKMLCVRHELILQQHHLVAWLRSWLSAYNYIIGRPRPNTSPSEARHLQLLKAQMLATLIGISNIKPTTQTSYDVYAPQFDEIIRLAESILTTDNPDTPPRSASSSPLPLRSNHCTTTTNLIPFSPVPGIIHPLSFTARKYRAPLRRRRAISLLSRAGIEGPLHAPFEALVASRIVALEEQGRHQPPDLHFQHLELTHQTSDTNNILRCQPIPQDLPPENDRICVAWIVMAMDRDGFSFWRDGKRKRPVDGHVETRPNVLKVCRRRRGPLMLGDDGGGDDDHHHRGHDLDVNEEGKGNQTGRLFRMLDGDGICAWEDLVSEEHKDEREHDPEEEDGIETIEL